MRRLFFMICALAAGCDADVTVDDTVPDSGAETDPRPADPGTQIGGIDCDTGRIVVSVQDADGASVSSAVTMSFSDGGTFTRDCAAEQTCQFEPFGAGEYSVSASAPGYAPASVNFTIGDDDQVGVSAEDCGALPIYERDVSITLTSDDGSGGGDGDILTSHIGLTIIDSSGAQTRGVSLTVDDPTWGVYTRDCTQRGCSWIDVDALGDYHLSVRGDDDEFGEMTVTVGAGDYSGVNELGDAVYEKGVTLHLMP
ncbi:MAG: hypothetical protein AAFV53_16445 [Myxococcota bacterium]